MDIISINELSVTEINLKRISVEHKDQLENALKMLMNCIKGADGHVIAIEISKKLAPTELEVLSGTVKEAEVRCKQARGYY